MENYVSVAGLKISCCLHKLVAEEILPGLKSMDELSVWKSLSDLVHELSPENTTLLNVRDDLQRQLDLWHKTRLGKPLNLKEYKQFLTKINYLLPKGRDFSITTGNVDAEISTIAGPQLVVPINNARFALNAANARWGSLYDALYGTDVITEKDGCEKMLGFNAKRGRKVIETAFSFLDHSIPLKEASYQDVVRFSLVRVFGEDRFRVQAELTNGKTTGIKDTEQFVGYNNDGRDRILLFIHHGLHIEIQVNPDHPIGKLHASAVKDIVLESAVTTIQDFEDSVAAVDAEDKTLAYQNLLGLMRGDLQESFYKQGKETTRTLNHDKVYTSADGKPLSLMGRSLMLIRNVGHHMMTNAVLTESGEEILEGILDGFMTALIGLYDLQGVGDFRNSRCGSLYIVKPKMHGPQEVAFSVKLFSRIEDELSLPRNTLKLGIMDEERRTTVNLTECIRAAKERVIFINTGFLDRTGDEIHSSMEAGAFLPKAEIKNQPWMTAYEDWNVEIGLACGMQGIAQIGKGMWAMPDLMADMVKEKIVHPEMGASCAWVPSPTAATLHAMHYHKINVAAQQEKIKLRPRASLDDILTIPLLSEQQLSAESIQQELDNNAQGILGYVVRWINQGIGCSKVPDIHQVGLMEDRATLRISSQHIANWLHHKICRKNQVVETFKKMAKVVDAQNSDDPDYINIAPDFSSIAFRASLELVLKGREQPNGYTEPLLHGFRRAFKQQL